MVRSPYPYDPRRGITALRRRDRRLGELIDRVGPFRLSVEVSVTPFHALLRAIVYQQLSGPAARAIYGRVRALFPSGTPDPRRMGAMPERELRAAGLSQAKVQAMKDLADKTITGVVPTSEVLESLSDEEIVARLTQVRGVGRWTVEMMLIFHLARPDVLSGQDLGIRKGLQIAYALSALPSPEEVLDAGQKWRPFRSIASWYLWRANDLT